MSTFAQFALNVAPDFCTDVALSRRAPRLRLTATRRGVVDRIFSGDGGGAYPVLRHALVAHPDKARRGARGAQGARGGGAGHCPTLQASPAARLARRCGLGLSWSHSAAPCPPTLPCKIALTTRDPLRPPCRQVPLTLSWLVREAHARGGVEFNMSAVVAFAESGEVGGRFALRLMVVEVLLLAGVAVMHAWNLASVFCMQASELAHVSRNALASERLARAPSLLVLAFVFVVVEAFRVSGRGGGVAGGGAPHAALPTAQHAHPSCLVPGALACSRSAPPRPRPRLARPPPPG